jgi:Cof subfamily protein (haloacid dehalogenase superfamily)
MIRLLAIDLDGTLYNSNHEISPAGKQAVHAAKAAGMQPVIVTGRGRRGAEAALDMLELDLPYVCSAGALVCAGKAREEVRIISARTFHKIDELRHLIAFARQTNLGLIADGVHGNLWFGEDALGDSLDPLTKVYAYESRRSFTPETDFDRPFLKVTLVAERDVLSEAEKLMDERCPSFHYTFAGLKYVDVTAQNVNKCSALEILVGHLGLSAAEVAAIGDQPIDVPMLECSGISAAMGNAVDRVKRSAKLVAPSNDEDGVAWFVDYLLRNAG